MVDSRRGRRGVIAAVVLVAWVGVLAWHVRREYFQPLSVRLAEASTNLIPAASFYTVQLGGSPIGYAASRLDTLPEGFVLEDDMRLQVNALGSEAPASVRTRVRLDRKVQLQDFEFNLQSSFGTFRVAGSMDGDSVLGLTVETGEDEQQIKIPTEQAIVLPQVMPLHFALGEDPTPGSTYSYEIFDPSVLDRQRVTLEVIGRETMIYADSADYDEDSEAWVPQRFDTVEAWHVRQTVGGIEVESWLDPDGLVVKATSPLGYTIKRTAFEIAWNGYRALQGATERSAALERPDIVERTAIAVGADLPRGGGLRELTVRLLNVDLDGFDLEGDRQRLRGDTLHVTAGTIPQNSGYRLPAESDDWREYLQATPLIQTRDSAIVRTAQAAADGSVDPVKVAERLTSWVYENLDKVVTLSVPSARQVLDAGRGDCNEHTVLFVALARALGLPTRTAAGLVYVRDRFYYHAWPEVWLGHWIAVDPTLDQFPADASHLRFVMGGLARQVELVRLIGLLQLDVLSVEER